MALESATYIDDLVTTNPVGSDDKSQGDDHIRLLKSTIKATFPNVTGIVSPTHSELNYVDVTNPGTSEASKALVTDSNGSIDINAHDAATYGLKLGGTLVTATAAELNVLDADLGSQGELLYLGTSAAPSKLGVGTSGQVLQTNGAGANPSWEDTDNIVGTIRAGTALELNPFVYNTTTTTAHGLGVEPFYIKVVLECLTAELGYSSGDKILMSAATIDTEDTDRGWAFIIDATNVTLIVEDSAPFLIIHKTNRASTSFTQANWKLTATPYRLVV